ncbi:MAG: hypothetical protein K5905_00740 [Roseibium sp.]|uniref:hypothetical protein n=1 Tax=Roseibium sp. TaxID=1936156 RepID=UPI002612E5C9|nr:hypothetical protein [Roseibium sp.]MCV0423974.1 hypothetical protein [Roseibium sp.]
MTNTLTADCRADDPARAEALMEHVIATFPRERLLTATLDEVASHYVRKHFPDAEPACKANLVACIEEAIEVGQSLYSISPRPKKNRRPSIFETSKGN